MTNPSHVPDVDARALKRMQEADAPFEARAAEILAGSFPSLRDLWRGLPFCSDDIETDARRWVGTLAVRNDVPAEVTPFLDAFRDDPCLETAQALLNATSQTCLHTATHTRLRFYLAAWESAPDQLWLAVQMFQFGYGQEHNDVVFQRARVGIASLIGNLNVPFARRSDHGEAHLRSLCRAYLAWQAVVEARSQSAAPAEEKSVDDLLDELETESEQARRLVAEDRAESEDAWRQRAPAVHHQVVGALDESGNSDRKQWKKSFAPLAGKRLPMVLRGDVGARRKALVARWPHAESLIDTILGDLATRDPVQFRPTIVAGQPGSGKTALLRAVAEIFEAPFQIYACAGAHDASFIGTSAQWSTARPSVPLELIRVFGVANPVMILDEIEKVSQDRRNGSLVEGLLTFLDRSQSSKIRDLCLETDVDLSRVSYLATANNVEDLPAPLRDRCRVLTMPDPSWSHVGVLVGQIVADIAEERGLHPGWIEPVAPDELALIRKVWTGGSLRRLRTAVTALVDSRPNPGRC